jgi:uncharacterized membrane protein
MNPMLVAAVLVGLGFLSGLRAFTPIALVSWLAIWGWMPLAGSPFWFIGTEIFATAILIFAVLELVGDKLPKTPPRIQPMPLLARIATGGLSGAAVAFSAGFGWVYGLLLGAVGSLIGAFGGYHLRWAIVQRLRLPDFIVALVEDGVAVGGTLFLVHSFFHAEL